MRRQRCAWCIPSRITTFDAEYLPIYAEEPGEQELVVLQCPAYMDGVQIPQPAHFQRFPYSPMPDCSPDSSSLEDGSHTPTSGSSTNLPTASQRQSGSTGIGNESDTTSSISSFTHANRGEAPPYFEVVPDANCNDLTSTEPHDAESTSTGAVSPSPPSESRKRTSLRSIINRISSSTASYASSAAFRFRPVSNHTRNSPRPKITTSPPSSSRTMISSSSISAPLTYTTVRTVFIPRKGGGGLTADQVRRIYSRDSFGIFGVPYGPDAVAFASWLSRNDLVFGGRPPGFEEVVGCGSGSGSGSGTTLRSDITDIIEGS